MSGPRWRPIPGCPGYEFDPESRAVRSHGRGGPRVLRGTYLPRREATKYVPTVDGVHIRITDREIAALVW